MKYPPNSRYAVVDRQRWRTDNTLVLYFMAVDWSEVLDYLSHCPDKVKPSLLVLEKWGRQLIEMEIKDVSRGSEDRVSCQRERSASGVDVGGR